MQRDIGDILDRWSIARLKKERIGKKENKREYVEYCAELRKIKRRYPRYDLKQFSKMMYDINDFIWQLEAGLKSGKEKLKNPHYILDASNKDALSNIGATTVLIRNINHLRISFKNIVNGLLATGFQDVKKDHLSEA